MLREFQQAFADLVASPALCLDVRKEPAILNERYQLSEREWIRLVAIVNDPGMSCNCTLYRANRLTPIALTLREVCDALGDQLAPLLQQYWDTHPGMNAHFLLESYDFCQFVKEQIVTQSMCSPNVLGLVDQSMNRLKLRIETEDLGLS